MFWMLKVQHLTSTLWWNGYCTLNSQYGKEFSLPPRLRQTWFRTVDRHECQTSVIFRDEWNVYIYLYASTSPSSNVYRYLPIYRNICTCIPSHFFYNKTSMISINWLCPVWSQQGDQVEQMLAGNPMLFRSWLNPHCSGLMAGRCDDRWQLFGSPARYRSVSLHGSLSLSLSLTHSLSLTLSRSAVCPDRFDFQFTGSRWQS